MIEGELKFFGHVMSREKLKILTVTEKLKEKRKMRHTEKYLDWSSQLSQEEKGI